MPKGLSSSQCTSSKYKRIDTHLDKGGHPVDTMDTDLVRITCNGFKMSAKRGSFSWAFLWAYISISFNVLLCSCFAGHMHPKRAPHVSSQNGAFDTLCFHLWMNGKKPHPSLVLQTRTALTTPTRQPPAVALPSIRCLPFYQVLRIQPRQQADNATAVAPVKNKKPATQKSVCKLETTRFYWHVHTLPVPFPCHHQRRAHTEVYLTVKKLGAGVQTQRRPTCIESRTLKTFERFWAFLTHFVDWFLYPAFPFSHCHCGNEFPSNQTATTKNKWPNTL